MSLATILWLIGLVGSIGGNLIHLLPLVALVVVLYNLPTGRRVGPHRSGRGGEAHGSTGGATLASDERVKSG